MACYLVANLAILHLVHPDLPPMAYTSPVRTTRVTLSNLALPLDSGGTTIVTGEASVLRHNGTFYFYFNDWGHCPGVDCCDSPAGCASCCQTKPPHPLKPGCTDPNNGSNPYGLYHQIVAYKTDDFVTWTNLGVVLPLTARKPGELMRPHVLFNAKTAQFVMWYEDRPETGYSVAVSPVGAGPFTTVANNIKVLLQALFLSFMGLATILPTTFVLYRTL